MSGPEFVVAESDEVVLERFARTARAIERARAGEREVGLVCGECGEQADVRDFPEDRDPWCLCGTLMRPAC